MAGGATSPEATDIGGKLPDFSPQEESDVKPGEPPKALIDMLSYAPAMIYTYTVDENNENPRFPFVSQGAMNVYGVSAADIMEDPNTLLGAINDEDVGSFVESVAESWRNLTNWDWVGRFRFANHKDGWRWCKCSSIPKRLPNNHTIWYGVAFDIDAHTRLAASESNLNLTVTENKLLQEENLAMGRKYAHAFDLVNDVVFSLRATSWEAKDWQVYESSKSFADYFPTDPSKPFLDIVDNSAVVEELVNAARGNAQPIRDLSVFRPHHSSDARTLRCRAVDLSHIEGFTSVLVVCHDLTDFKFRIEAEKDRQVAAKLQHEDKNLHKSQQLSAQYALEQLGIVETQLNAHRDAAARFESPELKKVWLDMEAVRELSSEAVRLAKTAMAGIANRSVRAQEDAVRDQCSKPEPSHLARVHLFAQTPRSILTSPGQHLRIMVYQMAAHEYVPVSTPINVMQCIEEEFGNETGVRLRGFQVPEVQLDWSLLRYALENALSNARKYGIDDAFIELAVEYQEPTLILQVTNAASPQRHTPIIARHGHDATRLLHQRGDSGAKHSTNLGGQAMRDVSRLLKGSVSLHLEPTSSRLRLEVRAPRVVDVEAGQPLLVYFIDDEPTMRMVYNSWIRQPSPLHADSRVFPPSGLSAAEADGVMRSFATEVLTARPRPSTVVLDQNLRSQVRRRENAITGVEIARTLRSAGFKGTIIIRSANISSKVVQEYLAAGADAVMYKDEPRERLVQLVLETRGDGASQASSDLHQTVPLLVANEEGFWGSIADIDERGAILSEFREGAKHTLDELRGLLENNDVGALPDELHYLLGQCRAVGAYRMQVIVGECKSSFNYGKLLRLEQLLAKTFEAMDIRCGAPQESTRAQYLRAKDLSERLRSLMETTERKTIPEARILKDPGSGSGSGSGSFKDVRPRDSHLKPGSSIEMNSKDPLPLVNFEKARELGDMLGMACIECEKLLEELHRSLASCNEHCQLLLHSLCGNYELMGATRLARLVVDCEAKATDFGPLQLLELKRLHAETLEALKFLGGPETASEATSSISASTCSAPTEVAKSPLFVAAIDDSSFARQVNEAMLFPLLYADKSVSKAVGETRAEQQGFVDFALGHVDASMRPLSPPHRPADVALLDENITLQDEPHLLGSDLAKQLRSRGFRGIICIISGMNEERRDALASQPSVDFVWPKTFNPPTLAARLLELHRVKVGGQGRSTDAESDYAAPRPSNLVNLEHFEGVPAEMVSGLLTQAYGKTTVLNVGAGGRPRYAEDSLYWQLTQLKDRSDNDDDISLISHTLKGAARCAGAEKFATEVLQYETGNRKPTVEGMNVMWSLLEATRDELIATDVLKAI